MEKRYTEFMDEITPDELYKGLLAHGLFTEKLPPVFTSEPFYQYFVEAERTFQNRWRDFVYFESMRDINIPRALGIPDPFAYQKLCRVLKDYWNQIQLHFHRQTDEIPYKISRLHLRKRRESSAIFKMNYQNWRTDPNPVDDICIGKKYVVHADISTCFPSIYTHSIPWALKGKSYAKSHQGDSEWFNKIDKACRNIRSGETHGLMIGPHASNLLSEIILTVVDRTLYEKGWRFIRTIDDFSCYVADHKKTEKFLADLNEALREFDLSLNHKKTKVEELPISSADDWVRQINTLNIGDAKKALRYKEVQLYLDFAVKLMEENGKKSSILNYIIKVISKKKMTDNAKTLFFKTVLHFALIYPYLVPLLEEYVFPSGNNDVDKIANFSNILYSDCLEKHNYEGVVFSIYFALKYGFTISNLDCNKAVSSNNCLFKLFSLLYFKRNNDNDAIINLTQNANELRQTDFDRFWIFLYEILSESNLSDEWKALKREGISFIKPEFST